MTETPNEPIAAPVEKPRSAVPMILLVLFAPMLFCGLLGYHFAMWSIGQTLSMARPLMDIAKFDAGALAMQAVLVAFTCGVLWYFTHDARVRPIFAAWFGASLAAFPAIGLRLLGPNNDQLGLLAQILLALIGAAIAWRFYKVPRDLSRPESDIHVAVQNRDINAAAQKPDWGWSALPAALMLAAMGIFPLVKVGALGSLSDFVLSLLAGLSIGLFAALLYRPTTGHVWSDGLGILGVLSLLAAAFGYDGGQVILLASLPLFAFALATLLPSLAAGAALTGLVAAAALAFIDPTELALVLADFTGIGLGAAFAVLGLAAGLSILALIVRALFKNTAGWHRPASMLGAALTWLAVIALYAFAGHPGFYGDRLFVIFKEQADLSSVAKIADRSERLTAAYQQMTTLADESQAELRATLDRFGVQYTPYYLVNAMEVQGGTLVRLYLLTRPEVERVLPSPRLRPIPPQEAGSGDITSVNGEPQWNITMIGADRVWTEFGARGAGIVIGQSDSGVDGSHPAIRDQYRGRASGDDYNWFDPWNGKASPYDVNGHGTHTLGTILGKDGIGIAPEAQWIGCVNLNRNLGNPPLYLDCMQFMLAPFPHGGDPFKDGDPTKAAHILNNSWGCPELEGCDPASLQAAADHLRAAGIFVAVSAGNEGPECGTVMSPLAIYDSVFSVGALDRDGNVTSFSSRGPVTVDGSGRVKPDIVAPGEGILSSMPGNSYGEMSGTSMAGPHVVGAVALLWSADPSLIGNIDRTEQLLIRSAGAYLGSRASGCFDGDIPNSAFGFGTLDVYQAVKLVLKK